MVNARMPARSRMRPLNMPPAIMPKPATEVINCALRSPPTLAANSGRMGGMAASVSPTAAFGEIITAYAHQKRQSRWGAAGATADVTT